MLGALECSLGVCLLACPCAISGGYHCIGVTEDCELRTMRLKCDCVVLSNDPIVQVCQTCSLSDMNPVHFRNWRSFFLLDSNPVHKLQQ